MEIKEGSYVPGKLIVTFRADSIDLNAGDSQFLTIRNIISQETRTEMEKLGIDTLERLAPLSFIGDTLRQIEGGNTVKVPDMSLIFLVSVSTETPIDSTIKYLHTLPGIVNVEPDYYLHLDSTEPDDEFYIDGDLWHLDGYYGIRAPGAWDHSTGDGIKIGIIDKGKWVELR